MTKIDISKVKASDQVQDVSGEWYTVEKAHNVRGYFKGCLFVPLHPDYLTAHKPAAAPEPVAVWLTDEDVASAQCLDGDMQPCLYTEDANDLLTSKYGPPPVLKTATGEEEGSDMVLFYNHHLGCWDTGLRRRLDPGDRYVELPKCCGEGGNA